MSDDSYNPMDRRPIASRDKRIFQIMAERLAALGVSPNGISIAGMFAAIVAGVALWYSGQRPDHATWLLLVAAVMIQMRLLANMLDGMVALASQKASRVGELYNEVPDRVSDVAVIVGAGYALGGNETMGYIAACVALFVAYVRAMGKAAGGPNDFCGPMAKPHRMFLLTVASLLGVAHSIFPELIPQMSWDEIFNRPRPYGYNPIGIMEIALLLLIVGGILTAIRRLLRLAKALREAS